MTQHPKKGTEPIQPKGIKQPTDTQTPKGPAACRLAIQINSSTFSTLLSSQRSNAHHPQPSQASVWGNPIKLTGSGRAVQVGLAEPLPRCSTVCSWLSRRLERARQPPEKVLV